MPRDVNPFKERTSTQRDGMGLGLSIVHDIIASHGGEISYETAEGYGTTFRLSLLSARCSEAKAE